MNIFAQRFSIIWQSGHIFKVCSSMKLQINNCIFVVHSMKLTVKDSYKRIRVPLNEESIGLTQADKLAYKVSTLNVDSDWRHSKHNRHFLSTKWETFSSKANKQMKTFHTPWQEQLQTTSQHPKFQCESFVSHIIQLTRPYSANLRPLTSYLLSLYMLVRICASSLWVVVQL